ncbi:CXXX repeat peptide modification system protein [Sporosalibacterium faouarense]|uniref:CXXX repeat peptide modification system protein n=1 Tax=Sporosalibacterium faouarense TaxID=516123 RepID=UPI00192AED5D|nr:CXXX repeat peptide modification system protein [Sporosalibacterium faouarense]
MEKELVGEVLEEEKYEILRLFERKIALEEVALTLENEGLNEKERDKLRKKVEEEYTKNKENLSTWWREKSEKYSWKKVKNGVWEIDFNTNKIILKG